MDRSKNVDDGSNSSDCVAFQYEENILSEDELLTSFKSTSDPPRSGIGLHLNVVAIDAHDNKNTTSFPPPKVGQVPLHESLATTSTSNGEDASQTYAYLVKEEFNENSPIKKRRKLEKWRKRPSLQTLQL